MPKYERPQPESDFCSKFIRVGDVMVVTLPDDISTLHDSLAEEEGVLEDVRRKKLEEPSEVDAGQFSVFRGEIRVYGESSKLGLPLCEDARIKSGVIFQTQSPGFEVNAIK